MTDWAPTAFVFDSCDILGLPVASGDRSRVAAALADRITARIRTQLAFVNANLSNICHRDKALQDSLSGFILLNDGVGVDLAARVLHGRPFVDNLNGTDFIPALLAQEKHSWRIFLLGAKPSVIERASRIVSERWPWHTVVGCTHGYADTDEEVALQIQDAHPDLVLVGTGNPRQELWIAKNIPSVCNCAIAVGAWFDFLTGEVPRAPGWVRTLRLEWMFRLALEPKRLAKRYIFGNAFFLARIFEARFGVGKLAERKRLAP